MFGGIFKKIKELNICLDELIGKMTTILFICKEITDKNIPAFKAEIMRPLYEERWKIEKNRKGEIILNKGAKIIEERDRLYEEILSKERAGIDMSDERNQLRAFDFILEMIK